jgi:hypothetical protein
MESIKNLHSQTNCSSKYIVLNKNWVVKLELRSKTNFYNYVRKMTELIELTEKYDISFLRFLKL